MFIEIIIGILSAVLLVVLCIKVYPNEMTVVWRRGLVIAALIYVVFAIVGKDMEWMGIEVLGVVLYGAFAWLAAKKSIFFLSLGWGLHVFWDLLLHSGGHPAFVPSWYPGVCLGFDLVIAGYFLWYFLDRRKEKS